MKKIILSVLFVGTFVSYVLFGNRNVVSVTTLPSEKNNTSGPSSVPSVPLTTPSLGGRFPGVDDENEGGGFVATPSFIPVQPQAPASQPAPATQPIAGKYKNGSYTGFSADAYYGKVQVKAIVQNGKLVDVQFLAYPSDQTTSKKISDRSMSILKSEAIQAQSAQVDVVSGATQLSQGFMQSLSDALSQAKS